MRILNGTRLNPRSISITNSDAEKTSEATPTGPQHKCFLTGMRKFSSQGSITMEYIVVSCFALLVSISAVTWVGKLAKARIESLSSKLGVDPGEFDISIEPLP